MAGNKWAVHEICIGNGQWTDEIVALETDFMLQTNANYTQLDKPRLLRDFIKFVLRISVHATWLIVDAQFPRSHRQTLQRFYLLRRC
jgi:hypothetical protein